MVLKPKIKILHKINIHSSKATVNLICSLNDFSSGRAGATKLGLVLRVETDRGSSRLKSKSWKKIKDEDEGVYNNFSRFVVKSFFVQIFFVGLGEKRKKGDSICTEMSFYKCVLDRKLITIWKENLDFKPEVSLHL